MRIWLIIIVAASLACTRFDDSGRPGNDGSSIDASMADADNTPDAMPPPDAWPPDATPPDACADPMTC